MERREGIVDGDAGGIVATVLETTEAVEEDLENVLSLFVRVEIQIREYSAHSSSMIYFSLALSKKFL